MRLASAAKHGVLCWRLFQCFETAVAALPGVSYHCLEMQGPFGNHSSRKLVIIFTDGLVPGTSAV